MGRLSLSAGVFGLRRFLLMVAALLVWAQGFSLGAPWLVVNLRGLSSRS